MSVLPIGKPGGRLESSFPTPFRNHRSASTPSNKSSFEPYSEYLRFQSSDAETNMPHTATLTELNLRLFTLAQSSGLSCHNHVNSSTSPDSTMSSRDSTKGKGISYTNAIFKFELERRNIFVSRKFPPGWNYLSLVVNEGAVQELNPPADSLMEAQYHLLDASNETTIVAEVIPKLLPMSDLLLSSSFEAIYDALWKVEPLPTCDEATSRLTSPKPDVTIGFNRKFLGSHRAMEALSTVSTPVICCPKLAFPVFTLEAKGMESTVFSSRQNMHNGACMLKNLYHLRSLARKDREDEKLVVFTVSVSPEKVSLHAHWVELIQDQLTYPSRELRMWSPGSDNLKSAVKSFSSVIYESLSRHATWIQEDLRTLDLALHECN